MKKNLVKIPEFQTKSEAFVYLRENASKIIAQKKALPTTTDDLDFGYSIKETHKAFEVKTKADTGGSQPIGQRTVDVEVIANMSGWCDSQMDVMIKDNWNRSISDLGASGQKLFYHLKDHGTFYQYTLDAVIGKRSELFTKMVDLEKEFNFTSDVKRAQALMMSSTVVEAYDRKAYIMYADHEIKQHSIGLQYIKLYLCMDSEEPEDTQYKENWTKYYPQVINKDKVNSRGYFWAVTEAKIMEVSAVLFGSNELTPVTSTGKLFSDGIENDSSIGAQVQTQAVEKVEEFDVRLAIKTTRFFNI